MWVRAHRLQQVGKRFAPLSSTLADLGRFTFDGCKNLGPPGCFIAVVVVGTCPASIMAPCHTVSANNTIAKVDSAILRYIRLPFLLICEAIQLLKGADTALHKVRTRKFPVWLPVYPNTTALVVYLW
jgi:hypothetical protein